MPEEYRRLVTVSFFGTVSAGSNNTLVSKYIDARFKVKRIIASFAPGVNRLMNLSYYISADESAPTTEPPTGTNVLAQVGQVTYITGDDEQKNLPHEVEYESRGAYVKVYAENSDSFDHTIDTQVIIELVASE